MGNFTTSFFDLAITIITLAGLFGLYLLTKFAVRAKSPPKDKMETMGHKWDGDLEELNNPLPKWWVNLFYITIVFFIKKHYF